jgi:hypothetical protein
MPNEFRPPVKSAENLALRANLGRSSETQEPDHSLQLTF